MKLTQVLSLPREALWNISGRAGETDYLLVYDRKTGNVFAVLSARRYGQNRTA